MDKLNLAQTLIEHGFKCNRDLKPNEGWNGLTVYYPLVRFYKKDVSVTLSLERHNVKEMIYSVERGIEVNTVTEKLIRITKDGELVYENSYGIEPENEILKSILN